LKIKKKEQEIEILKEYSRNSSILDDSCKADENDESKKDNPLKNLLMPLGYEKLN